MEKQKCLKINDVIKNVLMQALLQVVREEKQKGGPEIETRTLSEKLLNLADTKLYFTDSEYHKILEALNKLRDDFIATGRYTDGLDDIMVKIIKAPYKRCPRT